MSKQISSLGLMDAERQKNEAKDQVLWTEPDFTVNPARKDRDPRKWVLAGLQGTCWAV